MERGGILEGRMKKSCVSSSNPNWWFLWVRFHSTWLDGSQPLGKIPFPNWIQLSAISLLQISLTPASLFQYSKTEQGNGRTKEKGKEKHTWRRRIPEVKGGGSDFKWEMAELRVSRASDCVETPGNVRVWMVPMGLLGSPWQPFIDSEHDSYLCARFTTLQLLYTIITPKTYKWNKMNQESRC